MGHDWYVFGLTHVASQAVLRSFGGFMFGAGADARRGGHEFPAQKVYGDDSQYGHESEKVFLPGVLLFLCHIYKAVCATTSISTSAPLGSFPAWMHARAGFDLEK